MSLGPPAVKPPGEGAVLRALPATRSRCCSRPSSSARRRGCRGERRQTRTSCWRTSSRLLSSVRG